MTNKLILLFAFMAVQVSLSAQIREDAINQENNVSETEEEGGNWLDDEKWGQWRIAPSMAVPLGSFGSNHNRDVLAGFDLGIGILIPKTPVEITGRIGFFWADNREGEQQVAAGSHPDRYLYTLNNTSKGRLFSSNVSFKYHFKNNDADIIRPFVEAMVGTQQYMINNDLEISTERGNPDAPFEISNEDFGGFSYGYAVGFTYMELFYVRASHMIGSEIGFLNSSRLIEITDYEYQNDLRVVSNTHVVYLTVGLNIPFFKDGFVANWFRRN